MLGAINLQTILGAYLFGIMLFSIGKLTKKASIIWSIAYIIAFFTITILGSSFS
jgi:hypothetical protein